MNSTTSLLPSPTQSPAPTVDTPSEGDHGPNAVVSFIIGLLIILAASMMNAAGLNITKLDHVRTASLPKSSRRHHLLRPLWLLGMLLYILSQLLGSTLALQYMRAEYVAPLGSTSLIFNFLFASWLVGTPVTKTDIRGTIVVIIGVIGIVVFGSIHSSELSSVIDLARLQHFWSRAAWWGYFLLMSVLIFATYAGSSILGAVLAARSELDSPTQETQSSRSNPWFASGWLAWIGRIRKQVAAWEAYGKERIENLTDTSDDKLLAWTLGIGWSCCGGALAGGCLVFAKACVQLFAISVGPAQSTPFIHPAAILTLLLLIVTAVVQIVCLNRGLEAWDSTLVVPVFYGIYTSSGFLDSLIFYDEIHYYKFWVLCLIFLSIVVLVAGVILLSTKKPEKARVGRVGQVPMRDRRPADQAAKDEEEAIALTTGDGEAPAETMWELGEASDDDDDSPAKGEAAARHRPANGHIEGESLMELDDHGAEGSGSRLALSSQERNGSEGVDDFGDFTSSDAPRQLPRQ